MSELTDLQDLLTSPGWLRWKEAFREQWGARAYAEKLDRASREDHPVEGIMAVRAAKDAAFALLEWPESRVRHLETLVAADAQAPDLSRRGPL